MTAAGFRLAAEITCASCGRVFTGRWTGTRRGAQQCPACGRVFTATWPGFTFEPETVTVRPGTAGGGDHR